MTFADRADGGRRLGAELERFRGTDAVVLGVPRGGVVVAAEVARALDLPLDVLVVRKVGVPFQPELAMGALGEHGVATRNETVIRQAGVAPGELATLEQQARAELERRAALVRQVRPREPLTGRIAIVVDDGVATGASARAACTVARALGARQVVLATPIGPSGVAAVLRPAADEVVCVEAPTWLSAVGQFYRDFSAVTDDEVLGLLAAAAVDGPPALVDLSGTTAVEENIGRGGRP